MRQISKSNYVLAAFITLAIFALGMLMGLVIEGKRADYLQTVAREQKLDVASIQLQYQYISELAEEQNCQAMSVSLEEFVTALVKSQKRLEDYETDAKLNQEDFLATKQEYVQAELSYWLLAGKMRALCNKDIATVLYFYGSDESCPDCDSQAFVLTYLKNIFREKLLVFSIDYQLEREAMVKILTTNNNITEYPAIVLNNQTYQGLVSKEILLKEICKSFRANETPEVCQAS